MDDDDKPVTAEGPLEAIMKQDLGPLSIADLEHRIRTLNQEISRAEAAIAAKKNVLGAAHNIFKS